MSSYEERKADQRARAHEIAHQLAGSRLSRGIVRAMLALVEADERTDLPEPVAPGPAPGARQVLQKKAPEQEGLW